MSKTYLNSGVGGLPAGGKWTLACIVAVALLTSHATGAETAAAGQTLEELATWCDEHGLAAQAAETRAWAPPQSADKLSLALIPSQALVTSDGTASKDSGAIAEWRERFMAVRAKRAAVFFEQAQAALARGDEATAYRLLCHTVRENPDHAEARTMLGYTRVDDRWLTPFEAAKARAGQAWHPRFGWAPVEHLTRLENGERYYRRNWLPVEKERQLRARDGWTVETEHYNVWSNDDLETAARLAFELEQLYQAWRQLFYTYAAPANSLKNATSTTARSAPTRRMRVACFRNRDEYIATLAAREPQIGISSGYYSFRDNVAYFYVPDNDEAKNDSSNLYHEATHQLFQEVRRAARGVGVNSNFWAIEGIACHFESLTISGSLATIGGHDTPRFNAAKVRLLRDDFYVPLAELTKMSREELQRDNRIAQIYSQSSGLMQFFMHADDGRYRPALVAYLTDLYTANADASALSKHMKMDYPSLDQAYREYVEAAAIAN